jgi:hypothetical protein
VAERYCTPRETRGTAVHGLLIQPDVISCQRVLAEVIASKHSIAVADSPARRPSCRTSFGQRRICAGLLDARRKIGARFQTQAKVATAEAHARRNFGNRWDATDLQKGDGGLSGSLKPVSPVEELEGAPWPSRRPSATVAPLAAVEVEDDGGRLTWRLSRFDRCLRIHIRHDCSQGCIMLLVADPLILVQVAIRGRRVVLSLSKSSLSGDTHNGSCTMSRGRDCSTPRKDCGTFISNSVKIKRIGDRSAHRPSYE